jgi:hypothetical protein
MPSSRSPQQPEPKPDLKPAEFRRQARVLLKSVSQRAESRHEVEKQLRNYHKAGRLLLRTVPGKPGYGDGRIKKLSNVAGRKNASWLYKVRAFAQKYDRTQLKDLCQLAPDVRWAHVCHLLAVPSEDRSELQEEIKTNCWKPHEFRHIVRSRYCKQHSGGRHLKVPADPAAALQQIVSLGEGWSRYCDSVFSWKEEKEETRAKADKKKVDKRRDSKQLIKDTIKAVNALQAKCGTVVKALRRLSRRSGQRRRSKSR